MKSNSKILYELGNALPNWIGGFNNSFRYKGITLSGVVSTSVRAVRSTLRVSGRAHLRDHQEDIARPRRYLCGGWGSGFKSDNGTWTGTGQANIKQVKAQDYRNVVAPDKDNVIPEEMLNDASYIMFRN